jgi:tRNA C32,U32 (ribose-2'-O)-methylase TrmJ
MAVQVICYELRMAAPSRAAAGARQRLAARDRGRARAPARAPRAFAHDFGFLHPAHQKQVKLKLRRIFHKATLEYNELNILRGALTSLDPSKRRPRSGHE